MNTAQIELKNLAKLEVNTCAYSNGINLEAKIIDYDKSLGSMPEISKKLYFRVGTGPYNYGQGEASAWNSLEPALDRYFDVPKEIVTKPEDYLCWRFPQHERRLWQQGFPVYFGYFDKEKVIEIELDKSTAELLKKDFD